jgi:quercetin dioxygenase-like cupin family protein
MKLAAVFFGLLTLSQAQEMGTLRNLAENKLAPMPGMPGCIAMAVESGDPHKRGSVIVFKGTAGCVIPWHWHTPTEHVMIVSGTAKVEMKGGKTVALTSGGYAMMPGKHAHQFTCTAACTAFVSSDGAFDIHYLDASGKEITPEVALGKK